MAKRKVQEHGVSVAVKRIKNNLFIELSVTGKLTHEDYAAFIPVIEKALKSAKGLQVNLLVDMRDFKGWKEFRALVDDAKFGMKHLNDFDRIAAVGKRKWEEVALRAWGALSKAEVRFFKRKEKALDWLLR